MVFGRLLDREEVDPLLDLARIVRGLRIRRKIRSKSQPWTEVVFRSKPGHFEVWKELEHAIAEAEIRLRLIHSWTQGGAAGGTTQAIWPGLGPTRTMLFAAAGSTTGRGMGAISAPRISAPVIVTDLPFRPLTLAPHVRAPQSSGAWRMR